MFIILKIFDTVLNPLLLVLTEAKSIKYDEIAMTFVRIHSHSSSVVADILVK
jgi:hypothetical protein